MKKVLSTCSLAVLVVASLAGCGSKSQNSANASSSSGSSSNSSSNNSPKGSSNSSSNGSSGKKIVLRVMDWSDSSKKYRAHFDKLFEQEHPNVKVEYTQLTIDQFKNTILTDLKSNTAPDLFPIPTGLTLASAVNAHWFQPLNPYIDSKFKNSFVAGTFTDGTTMIGNKIYVIPEALSLPTTLVFYNKKILKQSGVTLGKLPLTYSQFRADAKKITQAGHGKFYGIIDAGTQTNRWTSVVTDWSALGGSGLNGNMPISLVTHKATYDSKSVQQLFSLFQGLAKDGSFDPKTTSINAPTARAMFAQGQDGFLEQGVWNVGDWNSKDPNLDYGVMPPPVPDSGIKGSLPLSTPTGWMGISATSKHPKIAAEYLKELYTGNYYQQANVKNGAFLSVVKGINSKYINSPQLKAYYQISEKYGKLVPNPVVKNPAMSKVFAKYQDVHPSAGELLAGVVAGAVSNIPSQLSTLSKKTQTNWDNAMAAAKKSGAKVSKNDYIFPNWKAMKNFTSQDYQTSN